MFWNKKKEQQEKKEEMIDISPTTKTYTQKTILILLYLHTAEAFFLYIIIKNCVSKIVGVNKLIRSIIRLISVNWQSIYSFKSTLNRKS